MKIIKRTDKFGIITYRNEQGELHREKGPARITKLGTKEWFLCNKRHRVNDPAVERYDGYKAWFKHGKRHRLDGAAIEYECGGKSYYINGRYYSQDKWKEKISKLKQINDTQLGNGKLK